MYFSLIRLDRAHPDAVTAARVLVGDGAYADHQAVWKFFPAPAGTSRDFLFRKLESADGESAPGFYAVSSRVPEQPHEAWKIRHKPYSPIVEPGQRLRFELRANPVVTNPKKGKQGRHDVVMQAKKSLMQEHGVPDWASIPVAARRPLYELVHEACAAWLGRAANINGFAFDKEVLHVDGYLQHRMKIAGRDISLSTADFSGVLTVTDPDVFGRALLQGIGHGKAFGCGLLLVRPA
jgi:CRISPR system Cascade subunit CasE